MDLLIGIVTSPRKQRYLIQTIEGIRRASLDHKPTILVQPNFVDPGEDWERVKALGCEVLPPLWDCTLEEKAAAIGWTEEKGSVYGSEWSHRGLQLNSDLLIRRLLERDEKWFVTMQDDLLFCPRAIDRIARVRGNIRNRINGTGDNVGLISFYSPYERFSRSRIALAIYPSSTFYGDLCLLWRREAAVHFLQHSRATEAHDLEIARVFQEQRRWLIWAHSPCLVQHAGIEASARGATNGGQRTTMNWIPNHDAVKQGKLLR